MVAVGPSRGRSGVLRIRPQLSKQRACDLSHDGSEVLRVHTPARKSSVPASRHSSSGCRLGSGTLAGAALGSGRGAHGSNLGPVPGLTGRNARSGRTYEFAALSGPEPSRPGSLPERRHRAFARGLQRPLRGARSDAEAQQLPPTAGFPRLRGGSWLQSTAGAPETNPERPPAYGKMLLGLAD
jgi:hypothetical protein